VEIGSDVWKAENQRGFSEKEGLPEGASARDDPERRDASGPGFLSCILASG